ncbi:MAG: hypothetical protein Q4D19_12245 [Lautropia sp.]|nr:hypothetical protein [Lautropia sp.]
MRPSYYDNVTTVESEQETNFRRTAMLDYGLHIGGIIASMGILSVIALVINYIQRPSARGTIYETHFNWMIRTCWWTLGWLAILTVPVAISFFTLSFLYFIPAIWYLYRMVKGLIYLNDRKPMPPAGSKF